MSSKRKIKRYLKLKEENKYNNLDCIFKIYIDGLLKELLEKYGFSKIEIFPEIWKDNNNLQINFRYYNLVVGVDLFNLRFDYVIYLPGITAEQLDKSFIESSYSDDFNIVNFIGDLYSILEKDNRLHKSKCK